MPYVKTEWVNNSAPDIDADNLNHIEQGIYDASYPDNGANGQLVGMVNSKPAWVAPITTAEIDTITGD